MEKLNNSELQIDTNIKKFLSEKGINEVISSEDINNEIEKLATKADSSCEIKKISDVDSSNIHISKSWWYPDEQSCWIYPRWWKIHWWHNYAIAKNSEKYAKRNINNYAFLVGLWYIIILIFFGCIWIK